jgi:hypothetical protein
MLCSCICTIVTSGGVIIVVSSSDPDLCSRRCNASSEGRVDSICPMEPCDQPRHQDEVASSRAVLDSNCLSRSRVIVWRDLPSSGGSCMELEPTATSTPFAHQAEAVTPRLSVHAYMQSYCVHEREVGRAARHRWQRAAERSRRSILTTISAVS